MSTVRPPPRDRRRGTGTDTCPTREGTGVPPTRRRFLATAASASTALAAGCLGSDGEGSTATGVDPDALSSPSLGAETSSVVVRAWEDFACPHCGTYNEVVLPELREAYLSSGRVRYEHHDFPIPVSQWSWPAAIAGRSVQATAGVEAFWTYASAVYADQDALGWATIRGAAGEAGADPDTVEAHARDERWRPVVEADRQAGSERGVQGTPTVFVNDAKVSTGGSWDAFYRNLAAAIDERLEA